jgi:UDPglucose--hexose-1-phosphate uridylyltransferase
LFFENDFAALKQKNCFGKQERRTTMNWRSKLFRAKPEEEFLSSLLFTKTNLTLPEMPAEAIENIVHTWQKNIQI